ILDPQRMRNLGITMQKMRDAIRASNADVGGRTVELSEFEYVIRGKGYLKSINDLGNIVLKNDGGTPVLLRDVAHLELGPDERRGITELNGEGEVAGGILLHVRSALVAILMLPVGVLMAFGAMKLFGIGSNIMSLGGIAIAIGAMVDAAIVMIENAHKHLERAEPGEPRTAILIDAASEVGRALFFSL